MRWTATLQAGLIAIVGLAACDVPTSLPKWNPTFAVPVRGTSIAVAQLLPPSVTIAGGNHFSLSVAPVTFGASLGQLCPPCRAAQGQTVPKPAFTGSFSAQLVLPPDVVGANISSGWLRFTATHQFSFDPLRPGGTQPGTVTVTVLADGRPVATKTISGADRAWPPGGALVDSLALAGSGNDFDLQLTLASPAGTSVRIDSNARITVTASPAQLLLSGARVRVQNRQVSGQTVQLNLGGIDDFITERVEGGKLVLTIHNGFGVGGTLTLTISGALMPITRQVLIPADDATVEVPFTEAELDSMLGRVITMAFSGLVSAGDAVAITPASTFNADALLVLELGPAS